MTQMPLLQVPAAFQHSAGVHTEPAQCVGGSSNATKTMTGRTSVALPAALYAVHVCKATQHISSVQADPPMPHGVVGVVKVNLAEALHVSGPELSALRHHDKGLHLSTTMHVVVSQ